MRASFRMVVKSDYWSVVYHFNLIAIRILSVLIYSGT
jgi:hypothetical protein